MSPTQDIYKRFM